MGEVQQRFQSFKPDDEERHTAKCPALNMVQNTGWIIRLHQDIKIKTIGNGEDITHISPFQSDKGQIVTKHMTHSFYLSLITGQKIQLKK